MAETGAEVVIRDHAGNEHVFPAGFDPTKAIMIVQQRNLAAGLTPLGDETASVPADTWSKGFHQSLNDQAKASMAGGTDLGVGRLPATVVGLAEGIPSGAIKGAVEMVKLPFTLLKGVVGGTASLLADPEGTLTRLLDGATSLPAAAKKQLEDARTLYQNDPEQFAKAVGELGGATAGGELTGSALGGMTKPTLRLTGKGMQYAGEHPFVARMSGGAMLGRGVLKGDPTTMAAGVATMALPKFLTTTGKALRELGGEDLSETLPSGARTIDMPSGARSIRVSPPRGAATPRQPIGMGETPVTETRLPSGARTLDVDASGLPVENTPPPMGSGYRTATPGSETGPAPYRTAARTAQRAEDLAKKAEDLKKRTVGMDTEETITSSESGITSDGERITARKTYSPAEEEGAIEEKPIMVGGRMIDPNNPETRRLYDQALQAQSGAPIGPSIRVGRPAPPVSSVEQAIEDAQRGYTGAERRAATGTSPTGVERRTAASTSGQPPSVAERAADLRAEGIQPPASKPEGAAMVNKAVQDARNGSVRTSPPSTASQILKGVKDPIKGATDDEIIALRTKHGAEEAGTLLANDPRFQNMPKTQRTNSIRTLAGDEAGLLPTSAQKDIDVKLNKMGSQEAAAYLAKAPNATAYNYIAKRMKKLGLLVDEE
jgi:hypothetical protein